MRVTPFALLLFFCLAGISYARDASGIFDKPLREKHVDLPPNPSMNGQVVTISCYYYPHFMIKEVFEGDPENKLSITYIPEDQKAPPCREKKLAEQKETDVNSSYFIGTIDHYIFFGSHMHEIAIDDGGFIVFHDTDEVFRDNTDNIGNILSAKLISPRMPDAQRPWLSNPLVLRYQRVYLAPCSLFMDQAACWNKVKLATGLTGGVPTCQQPYGNDDPMIIRYNVEAVLDGHGVSRATPISQILDCSQAP